MRNEGWERQNCRHNPRPPGGKIACEVTKGEQSTKVKDEYIGREKNIPKHMPVMNAIANKLVKNT
jgi:hypothetical protein